MPATPQWKAARNGLVPTNQSATAHADHINQHLVSHNVVPVYKGALKLTPTFSVSLFVNTTQSENEFNDYSQQFTVPGGFTALGRIAVPVRVVGGGADFTVSLVPDDGTGKPNLGTVLAQTRVPASWSAALSAQNGLPSAGPLATADLNPTLATNFISTSPWLGPAGDATGVALNPTVTTSGNFILMLGGATSASVPYVNTAQFLGGFNVASALAQPPLPQATQYGGAAATTNAVVYAGGVTTGSTIVSNVWAASWSPTGGQVGTWSAQAALPALVSSPAMVSFNNTVYVIGGDNGTNSLSTVYRSTVNNGQVGAWVTEVSLPKALQRPMAAVVGNWIVVTGGMATYATPSSASNSTYYTNINADGSLGQQWLTGPNLPVAVFSNFVNWDIVATDSAVVVVGGINSSNAAIGTVQTLAVGVEGPADQWWQASNWRKSASMPITAFMDTNGFWNVFDVDIQHSLIGFVQFLPIHMMSVPLQASLTPGNNYHVVIQMYNDPNDGTNFINLNLSFGAGYADALKRGRGTNGAWSAIFSGDCIPILFYDQSTTGKLWHTWEDITNTGNNPTSNVAVRTTTLVSKQFSLANGFCENTFVSNDPMNANPTFTTGVSSWTPAGCTFTQSNAQTHGGFPFSGLMTPNGVATEPSVTSEQVEYLQPPFSILMGRAHTVVVSGWFYSPTGWATGLSLKASWYDSSGALITTTTGTTTALTAATWTNLSARINTPRYVQTGGGQVSPTTATFVAITISEPGTPAAANTVFFSNVTLTLDYSCTPSVSSVSQISYNNGAWPPTGVVKLY